MRMMNLKCMVQPRPNVLLGTNGEKGEGGEEIATNEVEVVR